MIRLQKILSAAGVASRRASEQMILDGRVMVNGETVRELGTKADPGKDVIKVDGRPHGLSVDPATGDVYTSSTNASNWNVTRAALKK